MTKHITTDDLRRMEGQEGLVLQGCGGDPQEWVDGINETFTEAGILLNGSTFKAENVSVFQHDGLTNMLFPFEGVELKVDKLAIWRIQTHGRFGGTWLSDYVPNRLGGFLKGQPAPAKPFMQMQGRDRNIFSLMGDASQLLQLAGMHAQNKEMVDRVTSCEDYDKALNIISEYVDMELSDYTEKQPAPAKPSMQLQGHDGNIFAIMGRACQLLKQAGMEDQCEGMVERVSRSGDYNKALSIISEYVNTELSDHTQHQKSQKKKGNNNYER